MTDVAKTSTPIVSMARLWSDIRDQIVRGQALEAEGHLVGAMIQYSNALTGLSVARRYILYENASVLGDPVWSSLLLHEHQDSALSFFQVELMLRERFSKLKTAQRLAPTAPAAAASFESKRTSAVAAAPAGDVKRPAALQSLDPIVNATSKYLAFVSSASSSASSQPATGTLFARLQHASTTVIALFREQYNIPFAVSFSGRNAAAVMCGMALFIQSAFQKVRIVHMSRESFALQLVTPRKSLMSIYVAPDAESWPADDVMRLKKLWESGSTTGHARILFYTTLVAGGGERKQQQAHHHVLVDDRQWPAACVSAILKLACANAGKLEVESNQLNAIVTWIARNVDVSLLPKLVARAAWIAQHEHTRMRVIVGGAGDKGDVKSIAVPWSIAFARRFAYSEQAMTLSFVNKMLVKQPLAVGDVSHPTVVVLSGRVHLILSQPPTDVKPLTRLQRFISLASASSSPSSSLPWSEFCVMEDYAAACKYVTGIMFGIRSDVEGELDSKCICLQNSRLPQVLLQMGTFVLNRIPEQLQHMLAIPMQECKISLVSISTSGAGMLQEMTGDHLLLALDEIASDHRQRDRHNNFMRPVLSRNKSA